jgi:hypothetical protein
MTEQDLKKALADKVFAEDEKYSYIEDAQRGLISAIKDLDKFRNILCVKYKVYSITDLDSMINICKSLIDRTGEMLRNQSIRVTAMKELVQVSAVPQTVPVIEMTEEKQKEATPEKPKINTMVLVPAKGVSTKSPVEKSETGETKESPNEKKTYPGMDALIRRREQAKKAKETESMVRIPDKDSESS